MTQQLAMTPVAAAVFEVLTLDATLAGLIPGAVHDDVPEDPTYPFAWYEIPEDNDQYRGFGTGSLSEIDLRVHVYSSAGGRAEAETAIRRVIVLLKDASLTIASWTHCGTVFYDRTVHFPDENLNGRKVHEAVALFRIYAESA